MALQAASSQWDTHWQSQKKSFSLFSGLSLATRRFIFQPATAYYCKRFFADDGFFCETGCGTSESSALVSRGRRKFIGLDFSPIALGMARRVGCMDVLMQADIMALPYKSESLAGLWNLGVMEHFPEPAIRKCLDEFYRVLSVGGVMILFWPSEKNASRWILGPIEWVISKIRDQNFAFFPDEVSRLRSKQQAERYLREAGFEPLRIDFSLRTAFIHVVVVARKPA